jgi:hypothetical protein
MDALDDGLWVYRETVTIKVRDVATVSKLPYAPLFCSKNIQRESHPCALTLNHCTTWPYPRILA